MAETDTSRSLVCVVKRNCKIDKDVTHWNSRWGKNVCLQAINISSGKKSSQVVTHYYSLCLLFVHEFLILMDIINTVKNVLSHNLDKFFFITYSLSRRGELICLIKLFKQKIFIFQNEWLFQENKFLWSLFLVRK